MYLMNRHELCSLLGVYPIATGLLRDLSLTPGSVLRAAADYTFSRAHAHSSCLLKLYDAAEGEEELRVNELVEVYGVLDLDNDDGTRLIAIHQAHGASDMSMHCNS